MARFKVSVSTNKVGSRCEREFEVDDEDLEDLNEQEHDALVDEYARDVMFDMIDWGWDRVEDESE